MAALDVCLHLPIRDRDGFPAAFISIGDELTEPEPSAETLQNANPLRKPIPSDPRRYWNVHPAHTGCATRSRAPGSRDSPARGVSGKSGCTRLVGPAQ